MIQILPPKTNLGAEIGQGLGQGLNQGIQTGLNQGRLTSAFDKLKGMQGANFQEQLSAIAPILLSTPGGAQALEAIGPLLSSQGQLQAYKKSISEIRNETGQQGQNQSPQSQQQFQNQPNQQQNNQGLTPKQRYREAQLPQTSQNTFPQRTAGPQPQPELSSQQLQNYALSLMENSLNAGKPISKQEADASAQSYNNQIRTSNQQILKEKQLIDSAQKELSKNIVQRAENSGLIKDPEDKTVAEKFALEARNSENENEAYQYVRSKMRKYDSAKEALKREVGLTNPLSQGYRKVFGTYKDQNQIIKDIQRPLNEFRELGLYDEGFNLMSSELGLGNELANKAMFPNTPKENKDIDKFSSNTSIPRKPLVRHRGSTGPSPFPGEEYSLSDNDYVKFKDELGNFLKDNKDIDLVNLRTDLNQGKKYSWQNIYNAIDDLIDEGRFEPDLEQDKQLNTIRQAPMPGLASWFQYWWTGKK